MKTSFYFVLWIMIYPLLGLIGGSFINNNSFFVALIAVWGLSWLLNGSMPETIQYERTCRMGEIMEDAYTGNVAAFGKRLSRQAIVEVVGACYFIVSTAVLLLMTINGYSDWIALAVFAFLSLGAIARSVTLIKADSSLKRNPTAGQCAEISDKVYDLNYEAYAQDRAGYTLQEMLTPRPRHFKAFQIFSMVMAVIAAVLGLIFIVRGAALFLPRYSFEAGAYGGMQLLYGALALYFGVRDIIDIVRSLRMLRSVAPSA